MKKYLRILGICEIIDFVINFNHFQFDAILEGTLVIDV